MARGHPQRHFLITALPTNNCIFNIAKLIVERFKQKAKQILTVDNYDSELQLLFIEMYREMNRLQREYDDESNHSINVGGQLKWQTQISEELRNYGVR